MNQTATWRQTTGLRAALVPLLVAAATAARAHPGVGIVQDSRGNVFFTDLAQVWVVTPDGEQRIAVPDVHTHELCLDAGDNLYGEHLWYEGGTTNKWGHRVWRRAPDGTLSDVIPAREGFLTDYSFVRDRDGNMYWADRGETTVIKKRVAGGSTATLAAGGFRSVGRMTATPDGTIYLLDQGDLRRISRDGGVTTVVRQVSTHATPPPGVTGMNYHMGLWTDRQGNIYVAVASERAVLKFTIDGAAQMVARTDEPWAPSGGVVDRDGRLWLLEFDPDNTTRARRIDGGGRERIFSAGRPK